MYEIEYEPGKWRAISSDRVRQVSGLTWRRVADTFRRDGQLPAKLLNGETIRRNEGFDFNHHNIYL